MKFIYFFLELDSLQASNLQISGLPLLDMHRKLLLDCCIHFEKNVCKRDYNIPVPMWAGWRYIDAFF